jgi:hypothetical protein
MLDDDPGTRRPRQVEVDQAESALPGRLEEGDLRAAEAVRAAAAGIQGELTPAAYEAFRGRDPDRWPALDEIEARFGSFTAALAEASVERSDRV